MALVPVIVHGRVQLADMPIGAGGRAAARTVEESVRKAVVTRRRLYYEGAQYEQQNRDTMAANGLDPETDRLPEHLRLHAYSVQIQECVEFLCDQLAEGFKVEATDGAVQAVLDQMVLGTEALWAADDDGNPVMATDDPLRDALVGGDVAVEIRWDPIAGSVYLEFWESEQVEFQYKTARLVEKVLRTELVWRYDPVRDEERQVVERVEYAVEMNEFGRDECRKQTFWDGEDEPRETEWLGLPLIPWTLLRADGRGLRQPRGESVITRQCMESADRYNANEQVAYLIARYNSHGNLAVIGDGASLKLEQDGRVSKDVADVLTFPGGTALMQILLPTDPQMIEHQRQVLADAMYSSFGLVRVEPDTLNGLGGVSGYALEILNRKTEGTFRRIRRNWRTDWMILIDMVLDVTAYKAQAVLGVVDVETFEFTIADIEDPEFVMPPGLLPVVAFWEVQPDQVFPNRQVAIKMGSGYIVDDVMIRDDYVANLISRDDALRQRGRTDEQIQTINDEIEAEAPPPPEIGIPPGRQTGNGVAPPTGTAAGRTVGGTTDRG